MFSTLKPGSFMRLGGGIMSRQLYTSLPCWTEDKQDCDSFDWKYFLKPLAVKRTVETGDEIVTLPDLGESQPKKCLYHVISQALIHQQHDTENLKSQRVEKLKRKISTKLKPDDFLSSFAKVRKLEKSQSLNVASSSQVSKSELQRCVTDPGRAGTKITDKFQPVGNLYNDDKETRDSQTLSSHASTLSLADSGIDEVDAKMLSPCRTFRKPQLFVSPIKARKQKVDIKSELDDSDEEVSIIDNFSVLTPSKVMKNAPSSPAFPKSVESQKKRLSKQVSSKSENLKSGVIDLSKETEKVLDSDLTDKTLSRDVLSFDVVPPRIDSRKRTVHNSQRPSLKKESLDIMNVGVEDAQMKSEKTGEVPIKIVPATVHDKVVKERGDEKVDVGLAMYDIAPSESPVVKVSQSGVEDLKYPEVKKESAGLKEFHYVEEMYGKYTAIKNIRPDLQSSASRWTLPVLQRYIKKQYINLIQPMAPDAECQLTKKEQAHLKKQLIDQSILMFAPRRHFTKAYPQFGEFQNWRIQEADIRLFLNVLFRRLCLKLHMQMRVEERIIGDNLPNAVCDYAFYKNDICVGLLEAKSPSGLEPKAVPQFLVELLNIQARYGSDELSFFGILSDAHRFVFINLTGVKFCLEQTEMMQIHIHEVFSWNDLFSVADVILHNFHKQNMVLQKCLRSDSQGCESADDDSDVTILE